MRRIELKTLGDMEYRDLIENVVKAPEDRERGLGLDELRKGVRILDALDAANGTLELEDADWQHLQQKVDAMRWAWVDRRLLTFIDDVHGANAQQS